MNYIARVVVSFSIWLEARLMALRGWGSVKHWKEDCRNHPNPAERNRLVLDRICRDHPEFLDVLAR
ncbi:MAG: hypothetical protein A3C79_02645 [Candidatus Taylorbacteria bacterium RIFCSPHIGHO2_02_FULL_45_28]|uniref:Uncharacterized protein n=1 Tax=Candidatus Taylorbacteria bacterium RIFCSPHIGHO2_12_FULL_45_16 TaxID=1802315 RepID=A0A1G2MXT0_9BACT|nr:MAG: hypothetical protein A2830_03450 [Candidatus Taylorbacteria bacterium RIFCSPHIGHO2_01_FULL_44_110]OHA25348.1 MAG: hypothetical protein A3C79_02645 [Candidatus Taylorbacteria bacterium RIFCSPHIGHO2_02_FULL_45_28]OHA28735.1 MAG: hypothetical protein A3F51_03110 [Candidatus Taylorbacteria bacterium RIFCSPHIGHO2_12_FULL_45_16]OHA33008.1 MAG: hypothetical protein A3A23_01290 [Candidatus Taylorbacteria bacterium RIFCSPLOWO2_01_FULL_45_59]OHA39677.1 MAG: hypothetical protein A3I98_01010 [Candi